jgi:lipopolysaccharide/colanic/teichoic acid biosynthesis glycosyltransferase
MVHIMGSNWFGRIAAGVGLVATSPLLAACALAIRIENRGPILFRQVRMGINGKRFFLLKLRSMRSASSGTSITAGGDSRITKVGQLLRDYKLDELPQLWNVFRGDMNFIGPRPEVPEYVDLSDARWRAVLSVPPGITDLASLVFRHEERLLADCGDVETFYRECLLPRKLEISAHYARTRSTLSDIRLIALTIRHAFLRTELNHNKIARQFSYGGNLTWTK